MIGQIRVAAKLLGAILLVGLALFCGFGFLASNELGFPNGWHALDGAAGVAALLGASWLGVSAWRPFRLAALGSLFSLLAITTENRGYLLFLLFLLFLLPIPAKPRPEP
jgi:hypothetical protein